MCDATALERAVVAMLRKPSPIPSTGVKGDFLVRAFADPGDIIQAVFLIVDWEKIAESMARTD